MKSWLSAMLQILLLFVFAWVGKWLSATLQLHIPGSLIGMALLFICLQLGWIRLHWVEAGAALVFSQMILFFVPAIAGIMQYPWLLGIKGLLVLIVVVSGAALVMISTGVVAERVFKLGEVKRRDSVENM
ncbi:CidA/LrgA family protein [Brevibacillus choshinensis]|uniref:CidA/LrgA family protein n=1 Tax=Brevibacillus choshinensis TaxID=54911 RepID=UPI002E1C8D29|nr:CidA/LrgA family protein [Brevibacillus choshinensis]MED4583310.1 CidA/LrgA family protein [Brevibacillus choshinensis]MED4752595.1 CidA/LrgA family protein [Brevibacillus choshinensis]MED4782805.1 CidA/LrgA family protein [Brevibacillus choshinensis]